MASTAKVTCFCLVSKRQFVTCMLRMWHYLNVYFFIFLMSLNLVLAMEAQQHLVNLFLSLGADIKVGLIFLDYNVINAF